MQSPLSIVMPYFHFATLHVSQQVSLWNITYYYYHYYCKNRKLSAPQNNHIIEHK